MALIRGSKTASSIKESKHFSSTAEGINYSPFRAQSETLSSLPLTPGFVPRSAIFILKQDEERYLVEDTNLTDKDGKDIPLSDPRFYILIRNVKTKKSSLHSILFAEKTRPYKIEFYDDKLAVKFSDNPNIVCYHYEINKGATEVSIKKIATITPPANHYANAFAWRNPEELVCCYHLYDGGQLKSVCQITIMKISTDEKVTKISTVYNESIMSDAPRDGLYQVTRLEIFSDQSIAIIVGRPDAYLGCIFHSYWILNTDSKPEFWDSAAIINATDQYIVGVKRSSVFFINKNEKSEVTVISSDTQNHFEFTLNTIAIPFPNNCVGFLGRKNGIKLSFLIFSPKEFVGSISADPAGDFINGNYVSIRHASHVFLKSWTGECRVFGHLDNHLELQNRQQPLDILADALPRFSLALVRLALEYLFYNPNPALGLGEIYQLEAGSSETQAAYKENLCRFIKNFICYLKDPGYFPSKLDNFRITDFFKTTPANHRDRLERNLQELIDRKEILTIARMEEETITLINKFCQDTRDIQMYSHSLSRFLYEPLLVPGSFVPDHDKLTAVHLRIIVDLHRPIRCTI